MCRVCCVASVLFWSIKWPSEASNHRKNPLRGLDEGCALSGARKSVLTWGAARQKRRFLPKTQSKVTFLMFFSSFHPGFWAVGHLTLNNSQGVTP